MWPSQRGAAGYALSPTDLHGRGTVLSASEARSTSPRDGGVLETSPAASQAEPKKKVSLLRGGRLTSVDGESCADQHESIEFFSDVL